MKKTELFKLVKQSLKEVVNEQTELKEQSIINKARYDHLRKTPPSILQERKKQKGKKLLMEFPMGSGATGCGTPVNYGNLELFTGNCGDGGSNFVSEVINDGFICCSSNNNTDDNGDDPWEYIDTEWGPYNILGSVSFGGLNEEDECYCPYPNIDGNGDLVDCGISNNEFSIADLDSFLGSMGYGGVMTYTQYDNTSTGAGTNLGEECSGCYHSLATNDGMSTSGTQMGTGAQNPLFGCPNAGVHPNDETGRNNISCCDFEVLCATGAVQGYDDGVTMTTPIAPNPEPTNPSSITTEGPGTQLTHLWNTAGVFGSMTEAAGFGCTFDGCADDPSSGQMATNYTSVLYGPGATYNSGAPMIIDDGSCILSVDGCTDDGSNPNGNSPVPGIEACNYSAAATNDTGICEYASCAGCMDDGLGGTDGAGNSVFSATRPPGFVGEACNYDPTHIISDPDGLITSNTNAACNYTNCTGCMDDGYTNPGTNRPSHPHFVAGIAACNNQDGQVTYTNPDPDVCNYDTCAGCTDGGACSPHSTCVGLCTVDDGSCAYDCYGCMSVGMNGDAAGTPITIYNASYTIDNTIDMGTVPPTPTAPPASPCEWTGCLTPLAANNNPHSNYVCNDPTTYQLCLCGAQTCIAPDPGGTPDPSLGTFNDAGGCTEIDVPGCTNPADCSYDPLANSGDQTVGGPHCTGVPGTCEICGGAGPETDPTCGCTDALACNFNPTATSGGHNPSPFSNCTVPLNCFECDGIASPTNTNPPIASDECIGCTDPTACNYGWNILQNNPPDSYPTSYTDWTDNGSCVLPGANCQMCIGNVQPATSWNDPNWTEYDPACDGCATFSSTACNFDPNASTDPVLNPSWMTACVVPGVCQRCVSPPSPTNVDGVEVDPDCGCMDGGATEYAMGTPGVGSDGITAANYNLYGPNGTGGVATFTTDPGPGYNNFAVDGFESCEYAWGCTDITACNYDDQAVNDNGSCVIPGFCEICDGAQSPTNVTVIHDPICGCIDPIAVNYCATCTIQGTIPNDICTYVDGCTNPASCNYDPGATADDGTCTTPPAACEVCDGPVSPSNTNPPIHDTSCDGCTDPTACNYWATMPTEGNDDGSCVVPGDCEICDGTVSPTNVTLIHDPICGCIDQVANNFCSGCTQQGPSAASNPNLTSQGAAMNDCSYNLGCMDDTYCNYDSNATQDPGNICVNPFDPNNCEICDGAQGPGNLNAPIHDVSRIDCHCCTDNAACNYNPNQLSMATDDNSCVTTMFCEICSGPPTPQNTSVFHDPACGCTDSIANNYCGSCTQQGPSTPGLTSQGAQPNDCSYNLGCIDPASCNYDSGATQDDGSCTTPPGTCEICDGAQGPQNTNSPITDPHCECYTVEAHECNKEFNVRTFECMTVDQDPPILNQEFSFLISPDMHEQIDTQLKEAAIDATSDPQHGMIKKIYHIDNVSYSVTPQHPPVVDFDSDECIDQNWQCWCQAHGHPTQGQGWPGHLHGCKLTTDPVDGCSTFATKSECETLGGQGSCVGTQWQYPFNAGVASKPVHFSCAGGCPCDNDSSQYEELWTGQHHGSEDVYGCTDSNAQNYNSAATIDDGSCSYYCFTGDTLITMPDDTTRRIDELKVDEIVKSEKETSQIIKIDVHEGVVDLYSINGSKHFVTEEHPFQTTEGWKAITPAKATIKHEIVIIEEFVLKVGDTLIKENGETEEIITLEKSEEKISTTTYNLRLDNEHVYYANGYLVHNGGARRTIPLKEKEVGAGDGRIVPWDGPVDPKGTPVTPPTTGGPGYICAVSNDGTAVNHPSCVFATGHPDGHLGCCLPAGTQCPSNADCDPPNSCFALGGSSGGCEAGTIAEGTTVQESKKLRDTIKNEFFTSSKPSKKKLRETIRKIIKKDNK